MMKSKEIFFIKKWIVDKWLERNYSVSIKIKEQKIEDQTIY
jgi:hypothetical protein